MRSVALLALCLGLFAVAKALEQTEGVLLQGLTADEDMFKNGNVSALRGHHHWRRGGHHHDHSDGPYWERRHSAKSELLRCLKHAHDDCNMNDAFSLKAAGKRIAHCLLDHLGGCHDVPGLSGDITNTIPWIMAAQGFEALLAEGENGLVHAELVFTFYLAGGVPKLADGTTNPLYIPGGCASQLTALLTAGCQGAGFKQIWALAEVAAKLIEKIYTSTDDNLGLGNCAPDIPAVLVSLFASRCPAPVGGSTTGILFNPLTGTTRTCTPPEDENTYEHSAGALLGGSIYSLLLLSGNTKLQGLGIQVGFAAVRMALAATQTSSFQTCLGSANVPGQLATTLSLIPDFSGKLVTPAGTVQAKTPLNLGPDGQRVICATISMMSGVPDGMGVQVNWQRNLMWQSAADITNAIAKTVRAKSDLLTTTQVRGLCAVVRAIYTFSQQENPTTIPPVVSVPAFPPLINEAEFDWSCSTTTAICTALPPAWLSAFNEPLLALNHDLGSTSPYFQSCTAAFTPI